MVVGVNALLHRSVAWFRFRWRKSLFRKIRIQQCRESVSNRQGQRNVCTDHMFARSTVPGESNHVAIFRGISSRTYRKDLSRIRFPISGDVGICSVVSFGEVFAELDRHHLFEVFCVFSTRFVDFVDHPHDDNQPGSGSLGESGALRIFVRQPPGGYVAREGRIALAASDELGGIRNLR